MNGKEAKLVKELFNDIIKPELNHINNTMKEIKDTNEKQWDAIEQHSKNIAENNTGVNVNKTNISNIKSNFKNYIILASIILTSISTVVIIISVILGK